MSKVNIRKITEEKASEYVSQKDNILNLPLRFYTLTEDEDGWDKITYYTSRRKGKYAERGEGNQWVYILSNPSLTNMLKIGYTKHSPEVRAKQISASTGVPIPFKVEWAFRCFDGEYLEREVHKELETYRINKEFFDIPLEEAQEAIEKLGVNYI